MHLKIRYYKPKTLSVEFDIVETEDLLSKQTIQREQTRKKAKRNIPFMAKIHPQTFITLARLETDKKIAALVKVALYLTMKLEVKNSMEISVRAKEIEEDLKLSDKTVTKALEILEEMNLISLIQRGKYFISPKLGFCGYPDSWGIALENEELGSEKIQELISALQKHQEEATERHINKLIKQNEE